MRLSQMMDPVAQRLLELRTVSPSQLLLRGIGVAATVAALLLASPGPLDSNLGSILAAMTVACGLLIQVLRPDSDLGLLSPLAVLLLLAGQGGLGGTDPTAGQSAGASAGESVGASAGQSAGAVLADGALLTAAGVGFALLVAHTAFAIAATAPAHGVQSRSAWSLMGRGAATVLGGSVLASLVVVALIGVDLGPWMIVPGILAVIALFAVVLPRGD